MTYSAGFPNTNPPLVQTVIFLAKATISKASFGMKPGYTVLMSESPQNMIDWRTCPYCRKLDG